MGIPVKPQNEEIDTYSDTIERICCNDGEGDVYEQNLSNASNPSSVIQRFYEGANVLVTGSTSFLGMALIEKLLRSCPGINRVYLLIRKVNGQPAEKRATVMFQSPLFLPLLENNATILEKVCVLEGDLEGPMLGIGSEELEMIRKKVNVIFHIASASKPNETLRRAYFLNVNSTSEIVTLAESMHNLKAFVYSSTAFIHLHLKSERVQEKFFPALYMPSQMMAALKTVNDVAVAGLTKLILGKVPNTHVLTKIMAEEVIREKLGRLPIAIYRPSLVMNSYKEPVCGWNRSFHGVGALFFRLGLSALRIPKMSSHHRINIIPVDKCACALVALPWHIHSLRREKVDVTPIYNHVTDRNPVTWTRARSLMLRNIRIKWMLSNLMQKIMQLIRNNQIVQKLKFLLAKIVSLLPVTADVKQLSPPLRLRELYMKIGMSSEQLTSFTQRDLRFEDDNMQCLWSHMSMTDRSIYPLNVFDLDWDEYFRYVTTGFSCHVLKNLHDITGYAKDYEEKKIL
ncbi:unnamed protein product [Bemisia tabaci]|uniref:Fatty acyl-CoA reductase n=1 Tax=Bemisia tabaci TaxID=7038 RepID=A0A9P0A4R8_BEMTA|nr:unnamed protein product [Bemisia tabaci]